MVKCLQGEYGIPDLIAVTLNPKFRVSFSPFGRGGTVRYAGKGAPWKGVKGLEGVRGVNAGVAAGLEKAIAISKRHTEAGTAEVMHFGMRRILPLKVAKMLEEKGRATILAAVGTKEKIKEWREKYGKVPKYILITKRAPEALPLIV